MSIFRGPTVQRSWTAEPPIPRNSERGGVSAAGIAYGGAEGAMQTIAIDASVSLLSTLVEMLPLKVYSGEGQDKRRISTPRWLDDLGGDGFGLQDWMARGMYGFGLRGNITGEVLERDPVTGKARQIDQWHPDLVSVRRGEDGYPVWTYKGKQVDRSKVFHRRINPIPGYIMGASPVARHAMTIALGQASQQFGAQFFMDGGHPTALFQNKTKKLDPKQVSTVKSRVLAAMRGNREPLVMGADWDYKQLQVSPQDSQFLTTFDYTDAQCARIYGPGMPEMLGYKTGTGMTYQNREQRVLDFLSLTGDVWLCRFERLLSSLLPNPQYAEFERKALLRTDILTRFKAHEIALRNEWEVINEVRELENQSPVEWGDEPRPTKTTPLPTVQLED